MKQFEKNIAILKWIFCISAATTLLLGIFLGITEIADFLTPARHRMRMIVSCGLLLSFITGLGFAFAVIIKHQDDDEQ